MFAIFCLLFIIAPLLAGYAIIQPLHRRSVADKAAVRRYTMLDFFALLVQVQVYLAGAIAWWNQQGDYANRPVAGIILGLIMLGLLATWWGGVEAAARAKIATSKRRAAIHLVLLPGTVATMILADASLYAVGDHVAGMAGGFSRFADSDTGAFATGLIVAITAAGIVVLRWVAQWISREGT